jgi:hypothetical protein
MPKRNKFQVRSNAAEQRWQARDDRKEAFWRRHSDSWERSGLTKSAYCKEHELTYSCFLYWRREIENRDGEQVPTTNANALVAKMPERAANPFVPIRLHSDQVPEENDRRAPVKNAEKQQIEIALPGGAVIRLHDGCDPSFVAKLLSCLKA